MPKVAVADMRPQRLASPAIAAVSVVTLLVAIETGVERRDGVVYLDVDFGDGDPLRRLPLTGLPHLPEYTTSCEKSSTTRCWRTRLKYIYKREGQYRPRVTAFFHGGNVTRTAEVQQVISVYKDLRRDRNEYELLFASHISETKKGQNICLKNVPEGLDITVQFRVAQHSANESEERSLLTSSSRCFKHTFLRPGVYTVDVFIKNPVSAIQHSKVITAHDKISGLAILILGHREPIHLKTGRRVTLRGTFLTGSSVVCLWSIDTHLAISPQLDANDISNCTITFLALRHGKYEVELSASNPLGSTSPVRLSSGILVQDASEGLHLSVPHAVRWGSPFTVTATLSQGTNVSLTCYVSPVSRTMLANLGKSMRPRPSKASKSYAAVLAVRTTGRHRIRVRASNKVSSSWVTRLVYVWKPVSRRLHLRTVGCVRRGRENSPQLRVGVIGRGGGFYYQSGALFQWKSDDKEPFHTTSVPYFDVRLRKSSARPRLLVAKVTNPVSSITLETKLNAADCRVPALRCRVRSSDPGFVTVYFTKKLTSSALSSRTLQVIYQTAGNALKEISANVTILAKAASARWSQRFSSDDAVVLVTVRSFPIVHCVVEFRDAKKSGTSAAIVGPSVVSLYGISVPYSWEASSTHRPLRNPPFVYYRWVFAGTSPQVIGHERFTTAPAAPGVYALTLSVFDFKGRPQPELAASKNVTVVECVAIEEWTAFPTTFGSSSEFALSVTGTPPISIQVTFPDGSRRSWIAGEVPWMIGFEHKFDGRGLFPVLVNITNAVSTVTKSVVAAIETPMSRLTVSRRAYSDVVAVLEEVVLVAAVETGTGIEFEWDFGEDTVGQYTTVVSEGKSSVARHIFGVPGVYEVTVTARNALSREPLTARLNPAIKVVERINHLLLRVLQPHDVIPLYRCEDLPLSPSGAKIIPSGSFVTGIEEPKHQVSLKRRFVSESLRKTPHNGRRQWTGRRHVEQHAASVSARQAVKPSKPCQSTDELLFEAWVGRGSDVVFTFHFGDGKTQRVESYVDTRSMAVAAVGHRYETGGSFLVSVTATNPLGNASRVIDRPLLVQSPPEGLALDRQRYFVLRDSSQTFRALLDRGTNVTLVWTIIDVADFRHQGSSLTHRFEHSGTYTLAVEAHNRLTDELFLERPNVTATVFVQEILRDVRVCLGTAEQDLCSPGEFKVPLEHTASLTAILVPANQTEVKYLWFLGGNAVWSTEKPFLPEAFDKPGTYLVNVTCQNYFSNVSSALLTLHFVERLSDHRGIHHGGPALLHRPVHFQAFYRLGSNLTFRWDFGDGSDPVVVHSSHVWHIYNRTGEYWVKVVMWNAFSRAESETNVFVLEKPCNKPEVEIHPSFSQRPLNDPTYLETKVTTRCNTSVRVEYLWTISSSNGSALLLDDLKDAATRKDLVLPSGYLPQGTHKVSLKVRMKETIVYSVQEATLLVTEPTISATIYGGIWRTVDFHSTVSMSVRVSTDREREERGTTIDWKCGVLNSFGTRCFDRGLPWNPGATGFHFSPQYFTRPHNSYVFIANLTEGTRSTTVKQVIEVKMPDVPIRAVRAICVTCNGSEANAEEPVVLSADCYDCSSDSDEFWWDIWLFHEGDPYYYDGERGRDQRYRATRGTHAAVANATNSKKASKFLDNDPGKAMQHMPAAGPALLPSYHRVKASTTTKSSAGYVPGAQRPYIGDELHVSAEGMPGEVGEASARHLKTYDFERTPEEGDDAFQHVGGSGGMWHNSASARAQTRRPDISNREYYVEVLNGQSVKIPLSAFVAPSGRSTTRLVLRPGALKPGSIYRAQVSVIDKETQSVVGSAIHDLRVPVGPLEGQCNIVPAAATTSDVPLALSCVEWKSSHRPLFYEVSYSLTEEGAPFPVYAGFRSDVKFVLPPGDRSKDAKVYIKVAVSDRRGIRTSVRLVEKSVTVPAQNMSLLNYVRNAIHVRGSRLNSALGTQDTQAALNEIHVLSELLHITAKNSEVGNKRGKVMRRLIHIVKNMRLPSLYLKAYAGLVVSSIIMPAHEIMRNEVTDLMAMATDLAEPTVEVFPVNIHNFFISSITTLIGNILKMANHLGIHDKNLMTQSISLIKKSAQLSLKKLELTHDDLQWSTTWISISLGILRNRHITPIHTKWAKIFAETTIDRRPHSIQRGSLLSTCKAIHVYSFPYLPLYGGDLSIESQTEHCSAAASFLDTSSCNHLQTSLQTSELYSVHFLRSTLRWLQEEEQKEEFVIPVGFARVHTINVSAELLYHALYVRFDIIDGASIIEIYQSDSSLSTKLDDAEIRRSGRIVEIFLPEERVSDPIFLNVVISRKRRENLLWKIAYETSTITYTAQGFWQKCLSYDPGENTWRQQNSSVKATTDVDYVHCIGREPLMGMQSVALHLQQTDLPVANLIPYPLNMPVILFLVFIFLTFMALTRPVYKFERSMKYRKHVVTLQDNTETMHAKIYIVTLRTGPYFYAGTSATIFLTLHGTKGMTEPYELKDPDETTGLFQRGSRDAFIVSANIELGEIWKIEIWHNNGGPCPSWFLQDVFVTDCATGRNFYFHCYDWLAVDKGDGEVQKELLASPWRCNLIQELHMNLSAALNDHHLWNSVLSAPICTTFSRVQRLGACLSTLLWSAALCAMWLHYFEPEPAPHARVLRLSHWRILQAVVIASTVHVAHQVQIALLRNSRYPSVPGTIVNRITAVLSLYNPFATWKRNRTPSDYSGSDPGSAFVYSSEESLSTYDGRSLTSFTDTTVSETPKGSNRMDQNASVNSLAPLESALLKWHHFKVWARRHPTLASSLGCESPNHEDPDQQNPHRCLEEKSTIVRDARNEEYVSEMAYQVPSIVTDDTEPLPSWVSVFACAVTLCGICTSTVLVLSYTRTFQVLCNTLCLQLTLLSVIFSVVLLYPIQAFCIALLRTAQSCLRQESAFILNCKCGKGVRKLIECYTKIRRAKGCHLTGNLKSASGTWNTYAPRAPESVLMHARNAALWTSRAIRSFRYFAICAVTTTLLLQISFEEDLSAKYRQKMAILNTFQRSTGTKYSMEWFAVSVVPLLSTKMAPHLWSYTGSVCASAVHIYIRDASRTDDERSLTTLCSSNECFNNLRRGDSIGEVSMENVTASALRFVLYNPVPKHLSAVTLILNKVGSMNIQLHADAVVSSYGGHSSLQYDLWKVVLVLTILYHAKVLLWRIIKLQRQAFSNYWNICDTVFSIAGLCYILCNLLHAITLEEVSVAVKENTTELFHAVVILSLYEQVASSLLGVMLFVNMISVLRVFLEYRQEQISNSLRVIKKTWRVVFMLGLSWLVLMIAISCVHQTGKRRGLLHHCIRFLQIFLRGIGVTVPFDSEYPWCHVIAVLEKGVLLGGTVLFLSAVRTTLMLETRLCKSSRNCASLNWKRAARSLKKDMMVAFGKSYYGCVGNEDGRAVPAEFLLLELQYRMDELLEKANALFPVHAHCGYAMQPEQGNNPAAMIGQLRGSLDDISSDISSVMSDFYNDDVFSYPPSQVSVPESWEFRGGSSRRRPRARPAVTHGRKMSSPIRKCRVRRTHAMREVFIPLPPTSSSSSGETSNPQRRTLLHRIRRTRPLSKGALKHLDIDVLCKTRSTSGSERRNK
ncbi:uncharacterized protein LOC135367064 [Ornithodoros turicata]|uniref:uncharacterized protein LOC135367064 n=1 Tax=Ornithodoros turicata TaxID=34597 RepID=UPI003139B219